jgi:hypothetical protein
VQLEEVVVAALGFPRALAVLAPGVVGDVPAIVLGVLYREVEFEVVHRDFRVFLKDGGVVHALVILQLVL